MTKQDHYLMQFFSYEHLPPKLQVVSKHFSDLARIVFNTCPDNPETTTSLRKILEAKDCAVRSTIFKPRPKDAADEFIEAIVKAEQGRE